jgi:septum formation protein
LRWPATGAWPKAAPSSEIDAYIRTGEPMDKAGAYGIQAEGAGLVVEVEGERDNVMGLPVSEVLAALRRHTSVSRDGER